MPRKIMRIQSPDLSLAESRSPIIPSPNNIANSIVTRVMQTLLMTHATISTMPPSLEGVYHLRPKDLQGMLASTDQKQLPETLQEVIEAEDLSGLLKAVEISERGISILNKGGRTPKIGHGMLKEIVRGLLFNVKTHSIESIVQGTIAFENREDLGVGASHIKAMTEKEIRLQKLFEGEERVVQIHQVCTYQSKEKEGRASVEKIGITMEDCEEGDLFFALNDHADSYACQQFHEDKENVLLVVRDMLFILELLERKGVLHRDIKPKNLFLKKVNGFLRLKLGDFGLSGLIPEEKERLKRDGESVGGTLATYCLPPYMRACQELQSKDEKSRAESMQLIDTLCSHQIDVWAMGMVLYDFLMADLPPFAEDWETLTQEKIDEFLDENLVVDDIFWECLEGDHETQNVLFMLIRRMLRLNPDQILSGSELMSAILMAT